MKVKYKIYYKYIYVTNAKHIVSLGRWGPLILSELPKLTVLAKIRLY